MRLDSEEKILWGYIQSSGNIVSTSGGWYVGRIQAGIFLIQFEEPFGCTPAASCIPLGAILAFTDQWSANAVRFIFSGAVGGAAADPASFGFIIIGKRRK